MMNKETIKEFLKPNTKLKKVVFLFSVLFILLLLYSLPYYYPNIFNIVTAIIYISVFCVLLAFLLIILAYKEEKPTNEDKYIIPGYLVALCFIRMVAGGLFLVVPTILIYHFSVHYLGINKPITALIIVFIILPLITFIFFKRLGKYHIKETEVDILSRFVAQPLGDWATSPVLNWIAKNIKCPKCKGNLEEVHFFYQNKSFLAFRVWCKKCGIKNLKTGVFDKTLRWYD